MYHIAPSLFCADPMNLKTEITTLEKLGIDWYHVDIMDGTFVGNFALGSEFMKSLKQNTALPLYVHLMAVNPANQVQTLKQAGADYLCFHIETVNNPFKVANDIRQAGMHPCVALNPFTPIESLEPLLEAVEVVTVMSMEPGFLGQPFMEQAYSRISALRSMITRKGLSTLIEVDGAVNPQIGAKCIAAGADVLVAGFAFVFDRNYTIEEQYQKFMTLLQAA